MATDSLSTLIKGRAICYPAQTLHLRFSKAMRKLKNKILSSVNFWKAFFRAPPPPDLCFLEKKKCLCEMLLVTLWLSRLFGIAPIDWRHPKNQQFIREDGQCEFFVSPWWTAYSITLLVGYNFLFIHSYDFTEEVEWSEILRSVNSWSYYIFASILSIIGILKARALCTSLNDVATYLRQGLLCAHAKLTIHRTSRIGFILIMLQILVQYGALVFMAWNDNFDSHLSFSELIDKIVHNVPFMFYYLFSTIFSVFVGLFMCFDTTMLQTLNYDAIKTQLKTTGEWHLDSSSDDDDDSDGGRRFSVSTMKIERCKGRHLNVLKISILPTSVMDDLDMLRRLHESIRQSMIRTNGAFNPQVAIHLFIELTVLVMHLYSVILYSNVPNKSTDIFTIYCIDWLFVIVHTSGLLIFLLSCQGIRASVRSYNWPTPPRP